MFGNHNRSAFGWDYPAGAEHDPNAPWNQTEGERDFDDWMSLLDRLLDKHAGLTHEDLPDRCYLDDYEGGMTPEQVLKEMLEEQGE